MRFLLDPATLPYIIYMLRICPNIYIPMRGDEEIHWMAIHPSVSGRIRLFLEGYYCFWKDNICFWKDNICFFKDPSVPGRIKLFLEGQNVSGSAQYVSGRINKPLE